MERVNITGFGPGKVEIDVYTFDALPNTKFKRVGDAFQPILDGFYVGQEVWCELLCKQGVVKEFDGQLYPVNVEFTDEFAEYTLDGRWRTNFRPTLRPLQKFNVGQRVKDGRGREGVVISNTFRSNYPVMVQWDGDFTGHSSDSYDLFTHGGYYNAENSNHVKNITHA